MISAILLAGGKLEKSFRGHVQVASKAFLPLGGRLMMERVLDALQKVQALDQVVLVADLAALPNNVRNKIADVAPAGETIMDSLLNGSRMAKYENILAVPCDLPFLTPEAVLDFLESCSHRPAQIYYSYLSRETSESAYPGLRHTYVRLKEGVFCGGGLLLINCETLGICNAFFRKISEARKAPWRNAGLLGFSFLAGLLMGYLGLPTLTVSRLERRFSKILGVTVAGVLSSYPEIGFNVDKYEDYLLAQKYDERIKKQGEGASRKSEVRDEN